MAVDFVDVIKDEDHVSKQPEEEPHMHSAVSTGCFINSNVCFNSIHDKVGGVMVVRKEDNLSQIEEAGGIFEPKEIKSNAAISTSVITDQLQELKNDFESSEEMMKIPTPMCTIQHEIKLIFGPCLHNLLRNGAKHIQILQDKVNNYLLGTTLVTENISPCALPDLLELNEYQISKKYLENQTLRITCKARFPIKFLDYMLGILCRSWIHSTMNFNGRCQQSSMQARIQPHSMLTQQEYLHQPEPVHLLAKESLTESILRRYESFCGHAEKSALPKNHENWRTLNLFPKMKNRYLQTCIPKDSEWKTAFRATAKCCEFLVMCRKSICAQSILLMNKEKCSWRKCIGNHAVKTRFKSTIPTYSLGIFGRSWINFMINLKISDQWIGNEEAGKYETKFRANARIIDLLDFPMEPHNDWMNCHLMGDTKVYTSFLVHTNDITTIEEKITAIKDPKTCRNINEDESYHKLAGFYIRLLVNPSAMLSVFIDCTGKIETNLTGEL